MSDGRLQRWSATFADDERSRRASIEEDSGTGLGEQDMGVRARFFLSSSRPVKGTAFGAVS